MKFGGKNENIKRVKKSINIYLAFLGVSLVVRYLVFITLWVVGVEGLSISSLLSSKGSLLIVLSLGGFFSSTSFDSALAFSFIYGKPQINDKVRCFCLVNDMNLIRGFIDPVSAYLTKRTLPFQKKNAFLSEFADIRKLMAAFPGRRALPCL